MSVESWVNIGDGCQLRIDPESRMYYCKGAKVCHIGWDVAESRMQRLDNFLGKHDVFPHYIDCEIGTMDHFRSYVDLLEAAQRYCILKNTRCDADLSPQLCGLEGKRVEVIDNPGDKPRRFTVGKSTGWLPCRLELYNSRSRGGNPARLHYHDVRIVG